MTSIQPGSVATELPSHSNDEEALEGYGQPTGARSIVCALSLPEHVAANGAVVEPRGEPV